MFIGSAQPRKPCFASGVARLPGCQPVSTLAEHLENPPFSTSTNISYWEALQCACANICSLEMGCPAQALPVVAEEGDDPMTCTESNSSVVVIT